MVRIKELDHIGSNYCLFVEYFSTSGRSSSIQHSNIRYGQWERWQRASIFQAAWLNFSSLPDSIILISSASSWIGVASHATQNSDRYAAWSSQIGWGDPSTSSAPNGCWRCLLPEMVLTSEPRIWGWMEMRFVRRMKLDEDHGKCEI